MTEVFIEVGEFNQAIKAWPLTDIYETCEKLGIQKSTEKFQLLQVYKFFTPWHLSALCKHEWELEELADILDAQGSDYPEPVHESDRNLSYMQHNDNLVKRFCAMRRASK